MDARGSRFKKLFSISPFKIGIAITLAVIVLYFLDFPFLKFMELKALDLRMTSRGERLPGVETVIAAIDEKSLKELGRWPWSRSTMARLVNALKKYEARAVGLDMDFSEPDSNASLKDMAAIQKEAERLGIADSRLNDYIEEKKMKADRDADLAAALQDAGNVTLGFFFHTAKREIEHLTNKEIEEGAGRLSGSRYPVVQLRSTPETSTIIEALAAVPNIKSITDAAQNSGYFNAFPDSDGVIRWSPLAIRFQGDFYPSLAMAVLLQYLDWPMLSITLGEAGIEGIKIGDTEIPTDESGRMLVNFLGPGKTFPHYSATDVISGRIQPELLKDKIVLVGATATGIYDLRVTPYSAVFPGVEVHANVIDNILQGSFIHRPGWAGLLDILAILFFGILMSAVLPRTRALQSFFLSFAILALYITMNLFLFHRYSLWLDVVYPALAVLTVYVGVTAYKYVTEEREKKKVRDAFQFYLTSSVINEMLKDPAKLKLGGEKKELSVLFSDIRGFTTISEGMAPEMLVQLLNEYLTAMTGVVFRYNGLLDKYMGDAIMAVFGAPLDQPDHAVRACRTALSMMEELRKFRGKWKAEGRPVLDIGIGINSGEMVVGNMGSEMRFDYTVMGDSVNLGSRLEGINKEYGTHIIVSEYTYGQIKDHFVCRELDSVRVKGKQFAVRIYELIAEGKADDERYAFIGIFNEGVVKYKLGLWDEAAASFEKVLSVRPADRPSELYIRRCKELKRMPPEGAWDGVYVMTRK